MTQRFNHYESSVAEHVRIWSNQSFIDTKLSIFTGSSLLFHFPPETSYPTCIFSTRRSSSVFIESFEREGNSSLFWGDVFVFDFFGRKLIWATCVNILGKWKAISESLCQD